MENAKASSSPSAHIPTSLKAPSNFRTNPMLEEIVEQHQWLIKKPELTPDPHLSYLLFN